MSRGTGVDHHRHVDAVEGAPLEQQDLAAAALLGRGADDPHGHAEVVGHGGQGQARADGGRGDHVVAAGVADPGQRVVLGADGDLQRGRCPPSASKAVGSPPTPAVRRSPARPAPRPPRPPTAPPRSPPPGARGCGGRGRRARRGPRSPPPRPVASASFSHPSVTAEGLDTERSVVAAAPPGAVRSRTAVEVTSRSGKLSTGHVATGSVCEAGTACADRLVAILLMLQSRGQVTAAEVAEELEVSERTARRDLDALGMAGLPIYSTQGRNGGWRLAGGGRTDLSGLTAAEARALFLVAGPSSAATPRGQGRAAQAGAGAARSRSGPHAEAASRRSWSTPGAGTTAPRSAARRDRRPASTPCSGRWSRASRSRSATWPATGSRARRVVHPLGLAAKGRPGTWWPTPTPACARSGSTA